MGSVDFKGKKVPKPEAKAPGINKKVISRGELKASQMLIAELKDFPFNKKDLSYVVVSFDIIAYSAKEELTILLWRKQEVDLMMML